MFELSIHVSIIRGQSSSGKVTKHPSSAFDGYIAKGHTEPGIWIDPLLHPQEISDRIDYFLRRDQEVDKLEITDYNGFNTYQIKKDESLKTIHGVAKLINKYPDFGSELINYFDDIDNKKEYDKENSYLFNKYDTTIERAEQAALFDYIGIFKFTKGIRELHRDYNKVPDAITKVINKMAKFYTVTNRFYDVFVFRYWKRDKK